MVRCFEQVSGRAYRVTHVPEVLRANRAAATDPLEQSLAALVLAYGKGNAIEMGPTLKRFPLTLTSVRDFARSKG